MLVTYISSHALSRVSVEEKFCFLVCFDLEKDDVGMKGGYGVEWDVPGALCLRIHPLRQEVQLLVGETWPAKPLQALQTQRNQTLEAYLQV